jgi:hypothetical protein
MVAGILTATGDNDTATAGTAWRTGLQQYSYWSSGLRALPPTGYFLLRGALKQNSPKVLNISAGFGPDTLPLSDRLHAITYITDELRQVYTELPDLLIVVAAGNERNRMTPASYDSVSNVNLTIAALLRLRAVFPTRTVIVAGTRLGNNFWDTWFLDPKVGSNSFTGATDIAAPADFILVQDTVAAGKVGMDLASGTSFAAPQVAATAALLWSMDPTLTAANVKDYLLRGAIEGRRDSSTGVLNAPSPVQGVPNGVTYYQLDVYGSLSLLSRERPNTPICGYPVSADGIYNGGYVIRYRNGPLRPATDSIKVPGAGGTLGYVGVAQGGRTLSAYTQVDSLNNLQQGIIYFNHLGQRLGSSNPGVWGGRHYAEKHMVDHRQVSSPIGQEMTLRRADGTVEAFIPRLKYPDGTTVGSVPSWYIEISPDGRFVAFPAGGGTHVQRFAAPQTTIRVGDPGFVQFSKDGTKLVVFGTDSIGSTQTFNVYTIDNTAGGGFGLAHTYSAPANGLFLNPGVGYSGDDAMFYAFESNPFGVQIATRRPALAMGTIDSSATVAYREHRRIANVAARNP